MRSERVKDEPGRPVEKEGVVGENERGERTQRFVQWRGGEDPRNGEEGVGERERERWKGAWQMQSDINLMGE